VIVRENGADVIRRRVAAPSNVVKSFLPVHRVLPPCLNVTGADVLLN